MKNSYLKYIILFLLCFYGFNTIYAQVPAQVKVSKNKVILEGHIYYIHVVKPGHTLYSISKAYKVREKDIALENPGVYSGLQIGQVLKIPADVPEFEDGPQEVSIDTLKFFRHYLKEGETVYSLSRTYNVPLAEIEKANPDLDYKDIPVGQLILIPKPSITKEEVEFILHRVRARENLFRLSQRYDIDQELIEKYNPEVAIEGLKRGQVIKIPKKETIIADLTDEIVIEPAMDSMFLTDEMISDEDLMIIPIESYSDSLSYIERGNVKVAFLIPFDYYEEPVEIDSSDLKLLKELEEKEEEEKTMVKSPKFLEFFEGSLLAINKIKSEGYNVEVSYYDTRKSPSRVREILASEEFQGTDLIIGPFYPYNVEIVSEYSRNNGVPLVPPITDNCSMTEKNPFLFQLNPSYKIEFRTAARILAKEYEKNFIFVYSSDSLKIPEIEYFKSSLIGSVTIPEENFGIKEIVYDNAAKANLSDDLKLAFSDDKTNLIVIPESNEAFVSSVIQQLYFLHELEGYDIEVFGMPHFAGFNNIEYKYYFDLKLRYITPYYFSYQDSIVEQFLEEYASSFKVEPNLLTYKGYPFAFAGYDISYYFISRIAEYGNEFVMSLTENKKDEILIPFKWKRQNDYGGFENYQLKLVEFIEGYNFKVSDVSRLPFLYIEERQPWYMMFDQ
jgi:LysM repeat protein